MSKETPGFEEDIKPLFRDKDQSNMTFAFDLYDYGDVKENAAGIYENLESGDMPCDDPWSSERIALFKAWMDGGFQP